MSSGFRLSAFAFRLGVVALIACNAPKASSTIPPTPLEPPHAKTAADRILPLLPDGAQVIVEVDLARLRGNAVVGAVATRALARLGDAHVPGLPVAVAGSPLATADALVLASYGVGTSQAATVVVIATKDELAGGTRLAPDLVAIGPTEWVAQLETRAASGGGAMGTDLAALREHAMPAAATGAVLRATARLPFDARVALARETGLDAAPARLSVWGDVADDLVVLIYADAADPGDRTPKRVTQRLAATLHAAFVTLADDPTIRALGLAFPIADAELRQATGSWLRVKIEIAPRVLARAVERANALLGGQS